MILFASPSLLRRRLWAAAFGFGLALAPVAAAHAAHTKKPVAAHVSKTALHGYKTEAEAKAGCGADTVVWHARSSKVFHTAKSKYFGKTKHGSFVCEKAALAKGVHAGKS